MPTPPEQPRLSAEQRRALKLLARIPGGATEATLFAHGFWREMLAGLVLAGARNGDNGVYQGRRPGDESGSLPDHSCRTEGDRRLIERFNR
jgi:hypothetical protein